MTVCNMSIEAGAKAGLIAPDQTTFDYLQGRAHAPTGAAWDEAVAYWKTLATDEGATFDKEVALDARRDLPARLLGHEPRPGRRRSPTRCPTRPPSPTRSSATPPSGPSSTWASPPARRSRRSAVDTVFIGSCTNGRIEDLRAVAAVAEGRRVSSGMRTLVVPGSWAVKAQAEAEGIDRVLTEAGFDWRDPGCSMCLAMNPDKLAAASAAPPPATATSRAGRAGAGAPTSSPPPSPPPPPSPATSPPPTTSIDDHDRWKPYASSPAPPSRSTAPTSTPTRSSRPTGSSRSSAPASRRACSRSGATTATSCSTRSSTPAPRILVAGAELRHRLVARARRVGHPAVRVPGRRLAPLRRHLPQQRRPRTAWCRWWSRPRSASSCCAPSRPTPRSRSPSTSSAARSRRRPSGSRSSSRSTTRCSTGSSRASTTSASRSAAPTTSRATSARAAWLPTTA